MRSRSAFRLALAVLALATGVLVGPLPAQAAPANCQAPPGTSGIDQYCETVPAAGGDQGTRGGQSGRRLGDTLSRRTAAALRHSGGAGKAILGLSTGSGQASNSSSTGGNAANSGGSTGGNTANGSTGAGSHGRTAQGSQSAPAGRSDNPLDAIRSAVTSGGSAGPGFVWILVILGAIMAGLGWLRYRRSTSR